jgi:hypothetical protein
MSVHRNIIPNYSQQDATFLDLLIFTDTVHVSVGSSVEVMALVPSLPWYQLAAVLVDNI